MTFWLGDDLRRRRQIRDRVPPQISREGRDRFYMKRELDENLSGDEVHCTACSLLVILKNSFGKPHCQNGFNLVLFAYKIAEFSRVCKASF